MADSTDSTDSTDVDPRIEAAARMLSVWIDLLGRNPKELNWSVGKALRDAGFTDVESKRPALQMRVRRLKEKLNTENNSAGATAPSPVRILSLLVLRSPVYQSVPCNVVRGRPKLP